MRAVIQRCSRAGVSVNGKIVGEIDTGLTVFLGVSHDDDEKCAQRLAKKVLNLRIFNDENGKFNYSVRDVNGSILVISNFTLYGDARKGNRPNFMAAASPDLANELYEKFIIMLKEQGVPTASGVFGADMAVNVCNDGPVTLIIE